MKNELHILTSYVELLVMSRPVYHNTNVLESIKIERERLKEVLLFTFNQAQDRFQAALSLNKYYSHFTTLADVLWERARAHNPMARAALMVLISLIDYIELHYYDLLDQNNPLSAFESFKLWNHITTKLAAIQSLLVSKQVSAPLIYQVVKAFEDLFKKHRFRILVLADRNYIDLLLPELLELARDERGKDWNQRLKQLLIKNNFNHMGIYKLLETELERDILVIKDEQRQHDLLFHKDLWLKQIQPVKDVAYNHQARDLKSMLLMHVKIFGPHLKAQRKIRSREQQSKFKHKLSVDELSVQYHYEWTEGIYDYRSKKEGAIAFCNCNQSLERINISVDSFRNLDKLTQRNAALKYYQRIGRIQIQLKKDFDF